MDSIGTTRIRWAAIGAALAVTLGAGTLVTVEATTSSGERAVFHSITPCRLMDTSAADQVGDRSTPLGQDDAVTVGGRGPAGDCSAADLPPDAVALQLNVTAVGATAPTFLAITPDGSRDSSSLNPVPGAPPTPNAVTVELDTAGAFRIFNRFGEVDVIVDVTGHYTDHDHDDRYYTKAESDARTPSRTVELMVSPAGFTPTVVFGNDGDHPSFNVANIHGSYYSGGSTLNGLNLSAVASLDLPIGARITRVTYHYIDDSPLLLGSISFSIARGSLTSASQGSVSGSGFQTSGAVAEPRSESVTLDHVVQADEELHLSAFVRSVWPGEATKLTIKGVVVEYELP